MAETLFYVDDDSPEIAYFPFVNLEPSPNVTDGWQLLYTGSGAATGPGQVGVGTSYHYTSLNSASFLITWNGTGIDLMGNVSNALYNVTLDGIPNTSYSSDPANTLLASFNDLNNTTHSLLLTTIITNTSSPDAFLTFDKARITYTPPAGFVNTTSTTQSISDSDIAFMGLWSYVIDRSGNSMHVSHTAGDRAQTMFLGSAITIYGLTSSYSGNFIVTLDNVTTSLSAQSSYNNSDTLLFYATELPQDMPHQLTVTNLENRTLALRAGGMNVTFPGNGTISPTSSLETSSTPAGTVAAIVLAIVLLLVLCGIFYYALYRCRKARVPQQRDPAQNREQCNNEKADLDVERVIDISPPPGEEELETTSLSTSKGYGFGLGIRRGFPFAYRKGKLGSSSSGKSLNGSGLRTESHPMTPQHDRDEKRLSTNTMTEDLPVFHHAPEPEKLAPGWSNPVARMSPSFKHSDCCKEQHGISLPGLHSEPMESIDGNCEDDTDVKTLTSCQNEALAATLSLSPRTSEAPGGFGAAIYQNPETHDDSGDSLPNPRLLQVRDMSPFRVDVSAIFKGSRESKRTSGSGSSTWSRVRARLYQKAHRDDDRQSRPADGHEASSSSGPESVPVVMLESGSAGPPSETAPTSGTYSFLDFTASHASLRRHSKATTLSSTPAEVGHGTRETRAWSENTSIRMVRIERSRDDMLAPKPDAPSTASGGSHTGAPSDNSGGHTRPDAPTTHAHGSSPFPFPITITPSTHLPHPYNYVPERHTIPSPPTAIPQQHLLQVPPISPRSISEANSPTESVPFSVSDIHFRHSFSDYAGLDSRRASVASALPPHPPLPHRDSSQVGTPTYSPPPPYVVQRVLGLPMTPLCPVSPPAPPDSPTDTASTTRRPETVPSRIGSLLGPRPRPRPSTGGSIRSTAAPQLPMQGGRNSLRSPR